MADRIIIACTLALAAIYFYAIAGITVPRLGDPLGPRAFPMMIGAGLLVAAAMLVAEIWSARAASHRAAETDKVAEAATSAEPHHYPVVLAVVLATALYFACFESLGYPVATSFYLLALTSYFHRGRWKTNILTSVLFSFVSYFVFTEFLDIRLAPGVLPF